MAEQIMLGPVHHVTLRVTNLRRSTAFYQDLCGFQLVAELPDVTLLSNGTFILGLRRQVDTEGVDRFDEFRVGLDHLSFAVGSRADLDRSVQIFDQRNVPHGEIKSRERFWDVCPGVPRPG